MGQVSVAVGDPAYGEAGSTLPYCSIVTAARTGAAGVP